MSWFENGRHYLNLYLLIRDELAMDLGYLEYNDKCTNYVGNGIAFWIFLLFFISVSGFDNLFFLFPFSRFCPAVQIFFNVFI